MTNDRAIHLLESMAVDYPQERYQEAINMAIEALEMQDLCAEMLESAKPVSCSEKLNDLISRQEALDILDDFEADVELGERDSYKVCREKLLSLASRITEYKTFCGVPIEEAVRVMQEHNADKPTGDLISRQALCQYALNQKDKSVTPNDIMRFPSAEPKTGRWIGEGDGYSDGEIVYDTWYCSECDWCIEEDDQDALPNFCPNCGARMAPCKGGGKE